MQKFLYENFYLIQGFVGVVSIGAIVAECVRDVRRSEKESRELNKTIEASHRLTAEGMGRDDVKRKIKMMKELIKNGKK